ncbi:hypothetical protein AOLI_G00272530 [Acnodon oligacanthus]
MHEQPTISAIPQPYPGLMFTAAGRLGSTSASKKHDAREPTCSALWCRCGGVMFLFALRGSSTAESAEALLQQQEEEKEVALSSRISRRCSGDAEGTA